MINLSCNKSSLHGCGDMSAYVPISFEYAPSRGILKSGIEYAYVKL